MLDFIHELKVRDKQIQDLTVLLGQKEDEILVLKSDNDDLKVELDKTANENESVLMEKDQLTDKSKSLTAKLQEQECKNMQLSKILQQFQANAIIEKNEWLEREKELLQQISACNCGAVRRRVSC